MAILVCQTWLPAAILDFWKLKFSPFDHPFPKTPWGTKYHVDRQTGCKVMAIFVYPRWPPAANVHFGKRFLLLCCI